MKRKRDDDHEGKRQEKPPPRKIDITTNFPGRPNLNTPVLAYLQEIPDHNNLRELYISHAGSDLGPKKLRLLLDGNVAYLDQDELGHLADYLGVTVNVLTKIIREIANPSPKIDITFHFPGRPNLNTPVLAYLQEIPDHNNLRELYISHAGSDLGPSKLRLLLNGSVADPDQDELGHLADYLGVTVNVLSQIIREIANPSS
ncbi:MAG: hypothetical protein WAZ14_03540 [Patescibacteria group bacterium]